MANISGEKPMLGRRSIWSSVSVAALGTAASLLASQAMAQEDNTVEAVVVTAERRVQDLQETAISASVLDGETLEARAVFGLTSLQFAAPGFQISDYASANTFNIRGIGQAQVDIDLPSGVVIYRDGVPTLTGYFQNAPYYDMAGVEVLRGPQGTFVGKSAAAGAVFIRTRDPELGDKMTGEIMLGGGNHGLYEGTAVINMPLSDTLSIRFSTHGEGRESLFDSISSNPLPGATLEGGPFYGDDHRRLISARLGVLWKPNDSFRSVFKVDADYLHFGSHATSGLDPLTGEEQDMRNPIVNGPHTYIDKGLRSSWTNTYYFGDGFRVNALTGFSVVKTRADWDSNGANPAPSWFRSAGKFWNYSQELNLLSPDDRRFRYTLGLFYQRYVNDIEAHPKPGFNLYDGVFPGVPLITTPWKKNELNYAGFGQFEYDISDKLTVQVGARWSNYEFDQFTELVVYPGVLDIPFNEPPGGVFQKYSEKSVDWKINLNYKATEDHFLYALISRGHSPGSINIFSSPATVDPTSPLFGKHTPYEEMIVINYEAGWKGDFYQGQLKTQATVYYQTFENYQAGFALSGSLGIDSIQEFKNAETTSKIWGVELGAQGRFDALSLDFGMAYNKSELGSFGIINDIFGPWKNRTPAGPGLPSTIDLDGARTPFAPAWTVNGGVAYDFETEKMTITPRVDVAWRSDSYASIFRNRATLLEGGFVVNASLRFDADPWWAQLWVTNAFDRTYAGAKQNVTGENGLIEGIVYMAPPRLMGIRVGRSF
jgi:iron complex outermembrane recepter protein